MSDVTGKMRADWERRALEDANYYVAFGRREQQEAEFEATAADVVRNLDAELRRFGGAERIARLRALEIGCGPGRIMLPMSRRFAEIRGVDISAGMIRRAEERLRDVPNARASVNSGADLAVFEDNSFDFVYSYAVFQHIPSEEVVWSYLREARRVLRPGGLLRCQINGLPKTGADYDTWHGVRISADEAAAFARGQDMQLLALEGNETQYMWVTMRKQPEGFHARLLRDRPQANAVVRRLTNAFSTEPLAPCRGRFASVSLWMERIPDECDLLHLEARVGAGKATPFYLGPVENDGLRQLNLHLPAGLATGLQPVRLDWLGRMLAPEVTLRVVPPGPLVPRVVSLSDGVDLLSGPRISSGIIKVVAEEVERIEDFQASVDGCAMARIETFRVDPVPMRYEVNLHLPQGLAAGPHGLEMRLGERRFPQVIIETAGQIASR
jgi:ubiquinone/menaquinone biosynthesis C-methylase UbiE